MLVRSLPLVALWLGLAAQLAAAHGTAVQLSGVNGRLRSEKSFYVSESPFQAGGFLAGDLPGFEIAGPSSGIPLGADVLLWPSGKLWHWSPAGRTVADTAATLAIANSLGQVREIAGLAADQTPLAIAPYLGETPWHWHLDYFLAPLAAEPGGYAALFTPETAELAPGDPFLLIFGLLGEGFGSADLPEAVDELVAAALGAGGPLAGDANRDGQVDLSDFGILKLHFGQSPADWSEGDFDSSGAVDLSDFGLLKANFGSRGAASVPEPAALAIFCSGLVGWVVAARAGTVRARRR